MDNRSLDKKNIMTFYDVRINSENQKILNDCV